MRDKIIKALIDKYMNNEGNENIVRDAKEDLKITCETSWKQRLLNLFRNKDEQTNMMKKTVCTNCSIHHYVLSMK